MKSEQTEDDLICRICLEAEKQVDQEQETQLLFVAASGRNENVLLYSNSEKVVTEKRLTKN